MFYNSSGTLRSGWWIAIFLVFMLGLLLPLILVAQAHGVPVPIWQQGAVVLVASLACQLIRNRPASEFFGTLDTSWIAYLAYGGVFGAALMIVPALVLYLTGSVTWKLSGSGGQGLAAAFFLFSSVAVTEELMFRGFVFRRLTEGLGEWAGQGIAACFFLLVHVDALKSADGPVPLAWLNIFAASFLFGLACLRTGGLAMPIGMHLSANFVQGSLLGFGVSGGMDEGVLVPQLSGPQWWTGGSFGLEASAPGFACVLAAILFFRPRPAPRGTPG